MKKLFAAALLAVLAICFTSPAGASGEITQLTAEPEVTESAAVTIAGEVTEPEVTEPVTLILDLDPEPDTDAALSVPSADEVKDVITDTVDRIDWTLEGVALWEDAKAWILANLDMVVGGVLAFVTVIVGIFTRFRFVPKIIKAFRQLLNAVGGWYEKNTGELLALRTSAETFFSELRGTVDRMREQSDENNALREELAGLYRQYIDVTGRYAALSATLLEATMLQADELEELIQISPLTKADLDAHFVKYKAKKALIESARAADAAGREDNKNETGG